MPLFLIRLNLMHSVLNSVKLIGYMFLIWIKLIHSVPNAVKTDDQISIITPFLLIIWLTGINSVKQYPIVLNLVKIYPSVLNSVKLIG